MIIHVVDLETTSLEGAPVGKVVEVGIVAVDTVAKTVTPVYDSLVGHPAALVPRDAWIFTHEGATLTPEDVIAAPDQSKIISDVRKILYLQPATSFNVPFDFGRFLSREPWSVKASICADIMVAAGKIVPYGSRFGPRLDNAYRTLCPEDPAGINGPEHHRALDDAAMAAFVMLALMERRVYYPSISDPEEE